MIDFATRRMAYLLKQPELQVYVTDFGRQKGDMCYVSETDDKIVGAVWVRIMDDCRSYGLQAVV